jgi:hypothetical protein
MSDSLGFIIAIVIGEIVPSAIGLYAAYWAFSIRRALAGRIYRSHALWLGAACILFAGTNFLTYSPNATINAILNVYYVILIAILFAFIDSTVRVARRSDPLLRSILRWEKLRIALWTDVVMLGIFFVTVTVFFPSVPPGINAVVGYVLITALFTFPFIGGGPALLIGARRSKDPVLRGSLKWLGVAFLLLVVVGSLVSSVVSSIPGITQFDQYYSYAAIPSGIIALISAYAFYRSARSLAPTSRLQTIGPAMVSP